MERERGERVGVGVGKGFELFNLFFVKGETENYENTCKSGIITKKQLQMYTLNA